MHQKSFVLYRSSAGSGKTYTLAREYLKLVLKNPEKYKSILAVTFTNKATQEMKDRILLYLYEISKGEGAAMKKELMSFLSLGEEELLKRATTALNNILHNYSYFSISTIDSFFQKIIRNFAREIGLQSGFKLEMDQEKVLSEVIEMLLMDLRENNALKNWLVQYAREKVDEGKSWDITKDILDLGREVFKEDVKAIEKDILKLNSDPDFIKSYTAKLKKLTKSFESRVQALGAKACEIMRDYHLEVDDFSGKNKGVMGYLDKICKTGPSNPHKTAKNAFNNLNSWYTKTSVKKELIENAVSGGLNNVLGEVLTLFNKEYIHYQSALQILKFIYTYGILANIHQKLQQYRDENGLLLISDATAFLKEIIAENEAPFIYEKTGAVYKHFLIDEFQDTSKFQWANFKPLIANSIAEGNPNLVVGDIKQSIYRWRGGDWKLLLEQIATDIGQHNTEVLNLNTNWRSTKNIIDFNNSLFNIAPQVLSHLAIERLEKSDNVLEEGIRDGLIVEAQKIKNAYNDVFQIFPEAKITKDNFCGYVNMTFIDPESDSYEASDEEENEEESTPWKEEVKRRIPLLLEKFQDQGYALKDVAILVRNKKEGKEVASCILDYKNSNAKAGYVYEVISSEALSISGAITTLLLVNSLRVLNNNNDKIAQANLVYDYQKYILRRDLPDLHEVFINAVETELSSPLKLLPEAFKENYRYLARLPLYELVEELIRIFDLTQVPGEITYLQSFQDMVLNFMQEDKTDLNSFLDYWDEKGSETSISISDKLDAVKIITIHKSKGLQFRNVIVPFCDWKTEHDSKLSNIFWCNSDIAPFNEINSFPFKYSSTLENTIFQKAFFEEMIKSQMDYLNILYVAFTRAEESLYAFGRKPDFEKKRKVACMSSLLYYIFNQGYLEDKVQISAKKEEVVSNLNQFWKTEQAVFELGDPAIECKKETDLQAVPSTSFESYVSEPWRSRLNIKTRAREFFTEESLKKINYGNLMHRVLSKVKTYEQVEVVLNEMFFNGEIDKEDQLMIKQQLDEVLKNEVVRDWFTDKWEVKTEAPVLPQSGDVKRFDRVMLNGKEAIVVDFKSGLPFESHRSQIKDYAQLLQDMDYSPVQGYLVYLASGVVEKVL